MMVVVQPHSVIRSIYNVILTLYYLYKLTPLGSNPLFRSLPSRPHSPDNTYPPLVFSFFHLLPVKPAVVGSPSPSTARRSRLPNRFLAKSSGNRPPARQLQSMASKVEVGQVPTRLQAWGVTVPRRREERRLVGISFRPRARWCPP
jgi:hypothetical protein